MNKDAADEIAGMFFNEATFKPVVEAIHNKKESVTVWPIFEVKGSAGSTVDVCLALDAARATAHAARLRQYQIWQINKNGTKVLVERSHNEAGFAILNTGLQEKLKDYGRSGR